ncbi:hypothetical protein HPB50_027469 [Hyalomma asiaticum]|uniref:Uncharacterized protein n=1 Tax=Hyalomma asiaticum TaxID=266040 RepID=A0ACB7T515_HYAAI|nr:hypothetical protein HPB50_027469 [Hyalomma asiaticum]
MSNVSYSSTGWTKDLDRLPRLLNSELNRLASASGTRKNARRSYKLLTESYVVASTISACYDQEISHSRTRPAAVPKQQQPNNGTWDSTVEGASRSRSGKPTGKAQPEHAPDNRIPALEHENRVLKKVLEELRAALARMESGKVTSQPSSSTPPTPCKQQTIHNTHKRKAVERDSDTTQDDEMAPSDQEAPPVNTDCGLTKLNDKIETLANTLANFIETFKAYTEKADQRFARLEMLAAGPAATAAPQCRKPEPSPSKHTSPWMKQTATHTNSKTKMATDRNGIMIWQWNCNSLQKRKAPLKQLLLACKEKPHIILLQECGERKTAGGMGLQGYRVARPTLHPEQKKTRGVATLIRKGVMFAERDTPAYKQGLKNCLGGNSTTHDR